MNYLLLACKIEYDRAAKRLEELTQAEPGTKEYQERKVLLNMFVQFEKQTRNLYANKPTF